jgi:threonine dehydratase
MERPGLIDVLRARQTIRQYLPATPLIRYPALDELSGARVLVKHENLQPVGAFKVRGGINLMSQLTPDERSRGVIAASTGNHGQSVAYAAQVFGVEARIVVPENANPLKVASMQRLGAKVLFWGADFDEARERAEALAAESHFRYIHSGNEPLLVAGVGTLTLEILKSAPNVTSIIVPVGGGSGAAAACIVAKAINPAVSVIGVQAELAPAAYKSWKAKAIIQDKMETAAEGLATRVGFEFPQQVLWSDLDDFILVSEAEILRAISLYVEKARTVAEGAGAAPLAGLLKIKERLAGQTVALILSGGNITLDQLRAALSN